MRTFTERIWWLLDVLLGWSATWRGWRRGVWYHSAVGWTSDFLEAMMFGFDVVEKYVPDNSTDTRSQNAQIKSDSSTER